MTLGGCLSYVACQELLRDATEGGVRRTLPGVTSPAPQLTEPVVDPRTLRRGRHRDHALASWRRSRAVELKASGWTYEEIRQELGYAARGTVWRIVNQALEKREVEDVGFLRAVELARLDEMHEALWDAALAGSVAAVLALLRVHDARARLLGLCQGRPGKGPMRGWDHCSGPPTVVVSPNDCRHSGCARHGRFDGHTVVAPAGL